jgi:2-polyprenyl-3-methyl-5-hydroxy-6-metoxy-1,4-benzoquinol methylase
MKYAKDVVKSVVEYELHNLGLQQRPEYEVAPAYTLKKSSLSSHSQLLEMIGPPPRTVLDVGCGQGELGHLVRQRGHHVTGIDWAPPKFALDEFIQANLGSGLPLTPDRKFDVILLADVLEHMTEPAALLDQAKAHLAPGGSVLVSLPNAVHWSMRAQMALGKFEYANKGIMDRGHLRFFTKKTARRLFEDAGLEIVSERSTPIPWENVIPETLGKFTRDKVEKADYLMTRFWPNMFAYQNVFELRLR